MVLLQANLKKSILYLFIKNIENMKNDIRVIRLKN